MKQQLDLDLLQSIDEGGLLVASVPFVSMGFVFWRDSRPTTTTQREAVIALYQCGDLQLVHVRTVLFIVSIFSVKLSPQLRALLIGGDE